MTQSSLQTQCPKCDTRFRVTDAQLSVANGKVRCGNCMSVFNAIDHKIQDSATPPTPEKPVEPGTGNTQPGTTEDDFIFADNPEEDAAESTYTGTRLTFTDDELSDSFRSVNETARSSSFVDIDDDEESDESVDESWAEAILSDDDKPASEPAPEPAPKARKMPEPKPEPEPEPEPEPAPPAQKAPAEPVPEQDDYDGFFIDEPESPGFDDFQEAPDPVTETGPRVTESPYQNLRREPVGVSGSGGGRLRGLAWFVVVVALLGALVSQVVWFQFDRLSAIPQLRPLYEKGCEIFDCTLQPLIDVQSIQSRKLVVKTNPDNRSQLVVDAVIINRAAFEQPFPAIALTFSNLNNDVVAQSVFTPEEYLAGDGKDLKTMPTDTPVRIVINIRDPGKDAVNYNIAFQAHAG